MCICLHILAPGISLHVQGRVYKKSIHVVFYFSLWDLPHCQKSTKLNSPAAVVTHLTLILQLCCTTSSVNRTAPLIWNKEEQEQHAVTCSLCSEFVMDVKIHQWLCAQYGYSVLPW